MDEMNRPLPYSSSFKPRRFYADEVYGRIEKHIGDVIRNSREDEDIVVSVPLPDGSRLQVREFGFHNPNFIIVYGIDLETRDSTTTALISHTNIQVLINTIKKQKEQPRREIGFLGNVDPQDA